MRIRVLLFTQALIKRMFVTLLYIPQGADHGSPNILHTSDTAHAIDEHQLINVFFQPNQPYVTRDLCMASSIDRYTKL